MITLLLLRLLLKCLPIQALTRIVGLLFTAVVVRGTAVGLAAFAWARGIVRRGVVVIRSRHDECA